MVGDGDGGITRPAINDRVGDRLPTGMAEGVHHLQHRDAPAAAEVEGEQLRRFRQQAVEGRLVPFCQIHHMDVIAHARSIGCWPVVAKDLNLFAPAHGDLGDKWEEVVGNPQRVFTDPAAGMGADGVEITQTGDSPLIGSACCQVI